MRTTTAGEAAADGLRTAPAVERTAFTLTVGLAALALIAALVGLLVDGVYGEDESTSSMLRAYDLVTALVAVPALVASRAAVRRNGSDRARLVWLGMLGYLVYTGAYPVFGLGFTDWLLLHAAVFSLALFTLAAALAGTDTAGLAERFDPRRPTLPAVVLALLAAGLGAMWVIASLRFAATGEVPAGSVLVESDVIVRLGIVLDLTVLVPLYGLAGVLLWRRAPWGYVLAGLALVSGVVHQVSYLVALPFQVVADVPDAVGFDPFEPVIVLLYVVAAAVLLRGAGTGPSSSTELTPAP